MFNKKQNFDELLTCKKCKMYYSHPVILPCGNNICEEHINQAIRDNNSQSFKCFFCFKDHKAPEENGFILNRPFIDILNMNMHLGDKTKRIKKLIDDL
jgi:hypothetical protein